MTTADQYDLGRALSQENAARKACAARQDALATAIEERQRVMDSVQQQIGK